MRVLFFTLVLFGLMGGLSPGISGEYPSSLLESAKTYEGLDEHRDREFLRDFMNIDPVKIPWCAAFVNKILYINDIPSLDDMENVNPLYSRDFLKWGETVDPDQVQYGDIVVLTRGSWQGHVGFFAGKTDDGKWLILGGNYGDKVAIGAYPVSKVLGIRRYNINTNVYSRRFMGATS